MLATQSQAVDVIQKEKTWTQELVPRKLMPSSRIQNGLLAIDYCRVFLQWRPELNARIVHGVAIFEGLRTYIAVPYAVVAIRVRENGECVEKLFDVSYDVNVLDLSEYTVFVRTPPRNDGRSLDMNTLHILKPTRVCSMCGKVSKQVKECDAGCKCARYCSEKCMDAHAIRHTAWCSSARITIPDQKEHQPCGFYISMSPGLYR